MQSTLICQLRVQVISARNLTAKDRNGKSDPFVVVSLPGTAPSPNTGEYRRRTPVKQKTLDPVWKESEATFDFEVPIEWLDSALPLADESGPSSTTPPSGEGAQTYSIDRPDLPRRNSSFRKLSGAASTAGRLLVAPVKLGAAGAKAVGRGVPRPLRRKANVSSGKLSAAIENAPRGSIHLDGLDAVVSSLEFVLWDKDRFSGNDYLGECSLSVREWCREGEVEWAKAKPVWIPLVSSRRNSKVSGEVQVKVGFIPIKSASSSLLSPESAQKSKVGEQPNDPRSWTLEEIYRQLVISSLGSEGAAVRAIPASQSVGTAGPTEQFLDDGLSSDSESEDLRDGSDDGLSSSDSELDDEDASDTEDDEMFEQHYQSIAGVPIGSPPAQGSGVQLASASVPTPAAAAAAPQQQGRVRKVLGRLQRDKSGSLPVSGTATPLTDDTGPGMDALQSSSGQGIPAADSGVKRRRLKVGRRGKNKEKKAQTPGVESGRKKGVRRGKGRRTSKRKQEFAFKAEMGMDIIGIVMMEVKGAKDLPKWKNMTHTSFDMDPFTIVSFGQKIFRTRVARHTLNPVWDEKLLFHVRRHESNFQAKFLIYDWDKISSHDYVGGADISIATLIEASPKPDPETGLYKPDEDGNVSMKEFVLPLTRLDKDEDVKFGGKHSPTLTVHAKFTPYDALRQRFWRQLLQQFDTNDSGTISQLELTSMLDSLGSTLTTQTIEDLFASYGKRADSDELTIDEAIRALEWEIKKPWSQKRWAKDALGLDSGTQTPSLGSSLAAGVEGPGNHSDRGLNLTGPEAPAEGTPGVPKVEGEGGEPAVQPVDAQDPNVTRALANDLAALSIKSNNSSPKEKTPPSPSPPPATNKRAASSSTDSALADSQGSSSGEVSQSKSVERVIMLKSCPLCHLPRLSKKAEVDIVTHLAVCASQDWRRVDGMVVGNFVTASQAHRRWYTKVLTKISQGDYSLGANSANIIVQDRLTGELLEEKMQVYVRLGIRLLYKGAKSRMEDARVKKMLKNMSIKQGVKFDNPSSVREIVPFIAFHNLNKDEILEPLDSFKTFNEFFYRKLKPDARPIDQPDDPTRLVGGADCRMMAFETVQEATRIWIKGSEFSISRLLGDGAPRERKELDRYQNGGSVIIWRLAPQDYHRFHAGTDGVVERITWIDGEYYTVNPMAIRSTIDVYGENIRSVIKIRSDHFGTYYVVCVGAMMVGSTVLTIKEGDRIIRGQEIGYFKFGGSTLVVVFERGRTQFDKDILDNSSAAIETLVRVGMGIGKALVADPASPAV
ncbi:hypothetical protein IE53DRAFT_402784 [Violaceomyces palustris]|uniref:Uncharacterized protein n=1 Tax=Violaceomyces palustris TaxID=1673888 RepID=A0ACD0NN33_9BASI|nr:hypothetical protein IE53DRAFT_402784 [Violaceomyces palustris]